MLFPFLSTLDSVKFFRFDIWIKFSLEIICGKDKGKKGEVIEILRHQNRAKVKGINIIKKHEKVTKEKKGGIISKEAFIHISNLKNLEAKTKKEKL